MNDMDLALEECIRTYEQEISRKNTLESKASTILSTNAIVISILIGLVTLILTNSSNFKYVFVIIILNLFALILVFISIIYSLKTIEIKKRFIPFDIHDPNSLKRSLKSPSLYDELFKRYLNITAKIFDVNNSKCKYLMNSFKLLICGLSVSFFSILLIVLVFFKVI
jgi:hypothetical protein